MRTRNTCVVCGKFGLPHLKTFKDFPLYMGQAENDLEYEYVDQEWGVCDSCQCIQLKKLVDKDVLYAYPHNGAIGKTWDNHHTRFKDFIYDGLRFKGEGSFKVLEIGGGNGVLFNKIINTEKKYPYLKFFSEYHILDSNFSESLKDDRLHLTEKFFEIGEIPEESYDIIIMSHVFEHFYHPKSCVEDFYKILKPWGHVFISSPNITEALQRGYLNTLNFEHTYELNPFYLQTLFRADLFKKEKLVCNLECNIFAHFSKRALKQQHISSNTLSDINKKYNLEALELSQKVVKYEKVYLFGCHIFSQFLLYFGLPESSFEGVLDSDPNKQGKKLYGYNLKTFDPQVIKDDLEVAVVLRGGVYQKEIEEMLKKINPNVVIL